MEKLIEVKNISHNFFMGHDVVCKAVDNISFDIYKGETLGLVGESGSGKTTLGRAILHMYIPTSGEVYFEGKKLEPKDFSRKSNYRKQMQYIFQDPYASLNPRMMVSEIVGEPLDIHKMYKTKKERNIKIQNLLTLVGLNSEHANRYPHEFSGGQRQRIGIARTLAVNPSFIVCDEPVSALDVSIRAQILNKLTELQNELGLTYLFISHDLSVIRHVCNRVIVMYLGRVMEMCEIDQLFNNPKHPYSKALISSIPDMDSDNTDSRIILSGEIPSPTNPPSGCKFRTRCQYATPKCAMEEPELQNLNGHYVACFYAN